MRGRAARIDGSVQVRDSTLGIEDHNRRYKTVGELGHVPIYADSQQVSEKTFIQNEDIYRHIAKTKIIWATTPSKAMPRWKELLSPMMAG